MLEAALGLGGVHATWYMHCSQRLMAPRPRRPFQRKERCAVLEAALAARVAYMDVCDDADYSQRARGYHQQAVDAGVPAITTAGIYPGVSNVRPAHTPHDRPLLSCARLQ